MSELHPGNIIAEAGVALSAQPIETGLMTRCAQRNWPRGVVFYLVLSDVFNEGVCVVFLFLPL